ncbi:POK10 protein, partial [Calyptomena viridis]|nr:POK10 protein [Calyptomena viridis]
TAPWNYLGCQIAQHKIRPQPLKPKVPDEMTLNDLQQLLGAINWLRPVLGITTEELHPLFELLKGDPALTSVSVLTKEAHHAIQKYSEAIGQKHSWRRHPELPIQLALVANKFKPFAVLFRDHLRLLEWLFLSHSPPKTVWRITEMHSKLIIKGRERLQPMDGCDPQTIYVPVTMDNLNLLVAEDVLFQTVLAGYTGQLSIHYPKHHLWAENGNLPLTAASRHQMQPVEGITALTNAS